MSLMMNMITKTIIEKYDDNTNVCDDEYDHNDNIGARNIMTIEMSVMMKKITMTLLQEIELSVYALPTFQGEQWRAFQMWIIFVVLIIIMIMIIIIIIIIISSISSTVNVASDR